MAYAHDFVLRRACGHFKIRGQCVRFCDQRVITTHFGRFRKACKQAFAVVAHRRRLAVHESRRPDYLAAEHFDDGLMPQANAEHGHLTGECANHVHGYTGVIRSARPWRDAQMRGLQRLGLLDRDFVVAAHVDLRAPPGRLPRW